MAAAVRRGQAQTRPGCSASISSTRTRRSTPRPSSCRRSTRTRCRCRCGATATPSAGGISSNVDQQQVKPRDPRHPAVRRHRPRRMTTPDHPPSMQACRDQYDALEVKANYYAMIHRSTPQVGRLIEALRRTGQLDNTIVLYPLRPRRAARRPRPDAEGVPLLRRAGARSDDLVLARRASGRDWRARRWWTWWISPRRCLTRWASGSPGRCRGGPLLPILEGRADRIGKADVVSEFKDSIDVRRTTRTARWCSTGVEVGRLPRPSRRRDLRPGRGPGRVRQPVARHGAAGRAAEVPSRCARGHDHRRPAAHRRLLSCRCRIASAVVPAGGSRLIVRGATRRRQSLPPWQPGWLAQCSAQDAGRGRSASSRAR